LDENVMHKLRDSLCYLIGGIDFCDDQGRSWRRSLIKKCNTDYQLGIKFLDPTDKVDGLKQEIGSEQELIRNMKIEGKWDDLRLFMKKVIREDHRCIDYSDFVIVHIDVKTHTCGSYFELQSALTEKKPYFIIVEGGKAKTPSWLFGIVDHSYIFDNIEQVAYYLSSLSKGDIPLSDRWVLIREQLKKL